MTEVASGSRCEQAIGETIELVPDLKAEDLDVRLRIADRRTEIGHREVAFYLAEMHDRGLHQMLGYSTALEYACKRLEMGRRHAQELIVVGRALTELPLVDEAFCAGEIRWSRVRLLVRIAVPETERAWLDRALTLSWNEFDREVATSERGRPPREGRRGLPQVRIAIRGRVGRVDYETWEIAKKKLEDERGERMTDADVMSLAAHLIVGTERGAAESREPSGDSIYRVAIQKCPECEAASIRTAEGVEEIDRVTAECIECDARSVTLDEDPDHEDKTPRWLRDKILIRDGLACRVCRSQQQLMAHHIVWMSRQGKTIASNLITLCFRCHALVHEGLMVVTGTAPDAVTFTDRKGVPLDSSVPLVAAMARIRMGSSRSSILSLDVAGRSAAAAPASSTMTIDRIPSQASHEWWRQHRHLFRWVGSRGEMDFHEGVAAPIAPESGAELAAAPQTDRPDHRPVQFSEVVGQARAVRALRATAKAARKSETAADHVLLLGPPGLGKTTLAQALANEIGTTVHSVGASGIEDPAVLLRLLASVRDRDVVFVDEIHALPKRVVESLYEAMEDGRISITVTNGQVSRTLQILLPPFTLVGATTEIGSLPEPLVSRFPVREHLVEFAADELVSIVSRAAARGKVAVDDDAVRRVVAVSRGNARHAIGLVRRLRNEALADDRDRIDVQAVEAGLEGAGIDRDGLNALERRALDVLVTHGRPMGVARWAAASGLPPSTLRRLCEPELLRQGFIVVTPHGRMARTASARAQLRAVAREAVTYADLGTGTLAGFVSRDGLRLAMA